MEGFFLTGSFFDATEIKELLLRRYHSLDFFKDWELIDFIDFVNLAKEKETDEKLYQMYCAMLQPMDKFRTYSEFKDIMTGANIDQRPTEEILAEIEEIEAQFRKEHKYGS